MKWIRSFFIFSLLVIPLLFSVSHAEEKINGYREIIHINKDGTINVVEQILYDFGYNSRHGIFRDIPYLKTNSKGQKFDLKFTDFKVTDEKGVPYKFVISSKYFDHETDIKIGDPDRTLTGQHFYYISYKVSGAITYFDDHDELYWNVTGNDWPVDIDSSYAEIFLEDGANFTNATCYTGIIGSTQSACSSNIYKNVASFASLNTISTGEGWTIVASFPKGIVAVLEPSKDYADVIKTILYIIVGIVFVIAAIFWYLVLPFKILLKYLAARSERAKAKIVSAWFDAPHKKDHSLFSPAETAAIANGDFDNKLISATIINLAQRKYITITEMEKNQFVLSKLKEYSDSSKYEQLLMDALFSTGDIIALKKLANTISFYDKIGKVKKAISEDLLQQQVYTKNPAAYETQYTSLAILALVFIANIFLAVVAWLNSKMIPLTPFGIEKYGEAKSLYNFLSSQHDKLEFQAQNQIYFEKFLPYAIAFGVEKIWMDRFKDLNIQPSDWYEGTNYNGFVYGGFSHSFNSSVSQSYALATAKSSSSGFSSGFSGGSSGGGGGGGGGGSW